MPEPQKISSLGSSSEGEDEPREWGPRLSVFECEQGSFKKAKPAVSQEGGHVELRETREESKVLKSRQGHNKQRPRPGAAR